MNILKFTEFQMNKSSVVYNPSRSKLEEDNVADTIFQTLAPVLRSVFMEVRIPKP
jgi:hypothetical protein